MNLERGTPGTGGVEACLEPVLDLNSLDELLGSLLEINSDRAALPAATGAVCEPEKKRT